MKRFLQAFAEFWFPEVPAARLAVLRILIGAFSLWLVATECDVWVKTGYSSPTVFDPVGVIAILHRPLPGAVNEVLIIATLVLSVPFMLGWRYRFTGPAFALLLLWILSYRQSWSMIYHSMNLVVLHDLILAFAPAADVLSLDARRAAAAGKVPDPERRAWQYGFPIRLICGVTVLAYFVTGMAKVLGPLGWSWLTGEALRSQVAADALRKEVLGDAGSPLFYVLYNQLWLFALFGITTLALELGAPIALLNQRLARAWAVGAFLMHWGILFIMSITFRYHLSGISYASFFDVEKLLGWVGVLRAWRPLVPVRAVLAHALHALGPKPATREEQEQVRTLLDETKTRGA